MKRNAIQPKILELYLKGYLYNDIANELKLKISTVNYYGTKFRNNPELVKIRKNNIKLSSIEKQSLVVELPSELINTKPRKRKRKRNVKDKVTYKAVEENQSKYCKYLPDDIKALIGDLVDMSMLDILFANIQIQFATIIHAQKIMFVKDLDDHTVLKTSETIGESASSYTNTVAFAFDKMANLVNAQSKAMVTLGNLIHEYLEQLRYSDIIETTKHNTQLEIMKTKLKLLQAQADGVVGEDDNLVKLIESIDSIAKG